MRRTIAVIGVFLSVALVAPHASAQQEASATVEGGDLSTTASNVSFANSTLNGSNQTVTASAAAEWSTKDARGTGASWTVSIKGTTLTSAAGTSETIARTIDISNVSVSTGSVTAGTGSDPAAGLTSASGLALTAGDQTLLSSSGNHKGTYSYTPSFSLVVPANSYRSNYSGTATPGQPLNPYTATVTITTV